MYTYKILFLIGYLNKGFNLAPGRENRDRTGTPADRDTETMIALPLFFQLDLNMAANVNILVLHDSVATW